MTNVIQNCRRRTKKDDSHFYDPFIDVGPLRPNDDNIIVKNWNGSVNVVPDKNGHFGL
jgi:hypothetical protein